VRRISAHATHAQEGKLNRCINITIQNRLEVCRLAADLERLNSSRPEVQENDDAVLASLIEDLGEQDEQLQRLRNDLADVTERVRTCYSWLGLQILL
jgi:hypothetical protein